MSLRTFLCVHLITFRVEMTYSTQLEQNEQKSKAHFAAREDNLKGDNHCRSGRKSYAVFFQARQKSMPVNVSYAIYANL